MKKVNIPWAVWYKDTTFELSFPDDWEVRVYSMQDGPDIGEEGIKKGLQNPIGTAKISQLARNKNTAVIAVDDLSRPTPVSRILPHVVEELNRGGIPKNRMRIIMALGAHRPMTGQDLVKKLGREIVDTIDICNHNPYENLTYLGTSTRGTPIYINKYFMQGDMKIGIGGVIPHIGAGFGGGGKIVLPGIAGMESLEENHKPVCREETNKVGQIEGNENRADIEEVARKVGLDFTVNVVFNSHRGVAAFTAGDLIKAHRQAVKEARRIYSTVVPQNVDIALFNAYPRDTGGRGMGALNLYLSCKNKIVRENGIVILSTACSEGSQDVHFLEGFGGRLFSKFDGFSFSSKALQERRVILFSPNFSQADLRKNYSKEVVLFHHWEKLIRELHKDFKKGCRIAVFPCASIQLSELDGKILPIYR